MRETVYVAGVCGAVGGVRRADVDSRQGGDRQCQFNLATAIRTLVVLVMAWVMVFATGAQAGLGQITQRSLVFLVLSGAGDGRVLAVLLPRHPARQRVQGGAHR